MMKTRSMADNPCTLLAFVSADPSIIGEVASFANW